MNRGYPVKAIKNEEIPGITPRGKLPLWQMVDFYAAIKSVDSFEHPFKSFDMFYERD
jgi:hypothetical protein